MTGRRRQACVRVIAALLGAALLVPAAAAQPGPDDQARALYREGFDHYQRAEYQAAIDAWSEAYRLSNAPMLLFNIGQAYRLAGDCAHAMEFYDRYRSAEPAPKNADELAAATERCRDAARPAEPAEPPQAPEEPRAQPVAAEPAPVVTAPAPPVTRGGGGLRLAGAASAGLGIVLVGAAVYFALDAAGARDEIESGRGEWSESLQETETRGRRSGRLAVALGAGGALSLAAGGLLYYLGVVEGRREAPPVAVAPLPSGAALTVSGRF